MHEILNPESLNVPVGYSHAVILRPNRSLIFLSGQIGEDQSGKLSPDLVTQFAQALDNILLILRSAGGTSTDLVRLSIYVTNKQEYASRLEELGKVWRERFGSYYPAITLIEVKSLFNDKAQLELEATAGIL
jgi:enamine deaminase RidA (YjgF/YER057c/UK114 family)